MGKDDNNTMHHHSINLMILILRSISGKHSFVLVSLWLIMGASFAPAVVHSHNPTVAPLAINIFSKLNDDIYNQRSLVLEFM